LAEFELPLLCLVTDRRRCRGREIEDVVAAAVEGGAGMVQLRERDLPAGRLYGLARRLREITRGRALLLVNDRVDVALAAGADGVQLPEDGLGVEAARGTGGGRLLVGRSVHSVEGAIAAEAEGADLVLVGAIFETMSHANVEPQGADLLRQVSRRVDVPLLAIGGVTEENVDVVFESGASGAAVITAIAESDYPLEAARGLVRRMDRAWTRTGVARRA